MLSKEMYHDRNLYWFQWPNDKPTSFRAYSFGDREHVIVGRQSEKGKFYYGYIIPVSIFVDSDYAKEVSVQHPVESLREIVFGLIPTTEGIDSSLEFMKFNESRSPLFALERKKGLCYDRASIGVAIARSAGIEARVVGHDGMNTTMQKLINMLVRREIYPNYPHHWIEVRTENGWETLDTICGALEKYKTDAQRRYVCAEVPAQDMTSRRFIRSKGYRDIEYQVRPSRGGC